MNKNRKLYFTLAMTAIFSMLPLQQARTIDTTQYWMKIRALDKFERSVIANTGVAIEGYGEDYVIAYGSEVEMKRIAQMGNLVASSAVIEPKDFPSEDSEFHNYAEATAALQKLAAENPDIVAIESIGKSLEFRDIWAITLSTNPASSNTKPGIVFMGGHHAREHLSMDTPLRIAQNMIAAYRKGDARIVRLIESRDIHFIPMVNPDGAEHDIAGGRYKMWRKNRRQNPKGNYGVDLNRNYGYQWGTGGSSTDSSSDVYMGPTPFSEPETQAIKNFVENNTNITTLLSFHTFSELVLYPWGHSYEPISQEQDRRVHETMARTMAQWNGYTPQQSSDLYIASGDTTDWSYGEHKIISFTFELDPKNQWGGGGFYPGAGVINEVVRKNTEPVLYLIEHADNPYRVLDKSKAGTF